MAQHKNMSTILEQEHLCSFNAIDNAGDLIPLMSEPEVKQYLNDRVGRLVFDLTVLAAVEFGLIRLVSASEVKIERVDLPLAVLAQDARLAIAKYDTTDTKPCKTAQRILAGDIYPVDIFLFTGDLQKYLLFGDGHYASLEEGVKHFSTDLASHLNRSGDVVSDLISGMWAEFQQTVWRVRLLVMFEARQGVSKEYEIRKALSGFRDKWL